MSFLKRNRDIIFLVLFGLLLLFVLKPMSFDRIFLYFQKATAAITDAIKTSDLVTVAAAFGGSWAAFLLEGLRRKRSDIEIQMAALRKTAFLLASQYDILLRHKKYRLDSEENNDFRWMTLKPLQPLDFSHLMIDVGSLHFLLKDHAQFLLELQIAQECFFTAIQASNARNAFHINDFQIKAEQLEQIHGNLSNEKLKDLLGGRIAISLKTATDDVYQSNKHAIRKISSAIEEHHAMSNQLFPNQAFSRAVTDA